MFASATEVKNPAPLREEEEKVWVGRVGKRLESVAAEDMRVCTASVGLPSAFLVVGVGAANKLRVEHLLAALVTDTLLGGGGSPANQPSVVRFLG